MDGYTYDPNDMFQPVVRRAIDNLSIAELVRRSSDYGHRRRPALVVDGEVVHETLRQRLAREAVELEEAIVALSGKLADRRRQLKSLERFPETDDELPDGTVITFTKSFPNSPDKHYQYSAVRTNARWSVTGKRAPQNVTWDKLIDWMGLGVDDIYVVPVDTKALRKLT